MTTRAKHIPTKVISFRSLKNLREKEFLSGLSSAPCHVGDIFESLDDQYSYWNLLMNQVLDDRAPLWRMKVRARDVRIWIAIGNKKSGWKKDTRKSRLRVRLRITSDRWKSGEMRQQNYGGKLWRSIGRGRRNILGLSPENSTKLLSHFLIQGPGASTESLLIWTEYMKGIKRQLPTTLQAISPGSLWTLEILSFWHLRKNSL